MLKIGYELVGSVPKPPKTKYQLTREQTKELISAVGDQGFLAVEYFLFLEAVGDTSKEFGPKLLSDHFGWGYEKSRKVMVKLKKAGIYSRESTWNSNTTRRMFTLDLTHFPPKGA